MGDYKTALSHYNKALEIRQKALPDNHPDLAVVIQQHRFGISQHGRLQSSALSLQQSPWHSSESSPRPIILTWERHTTTSLWYITTWATTEQRSLTTTEPSTFYQKALPDNHPHLASSYNNIALVYHNMGDYKAALSHYNQSPWHSSESSPRQSSWLGIVIQQHRRGIQQHGRLQNSALLLSTKLTICSRKLSQTIILTWHRHTTTSREYTTTWATTKQRSLTTTKPSTVSSRKLSLTIILTWHRHTTTSLWYVTRHGRLRSSALSLQQSPRHSSESSPR